MKKIFRFIELVLFVVFDGSVVGLIVIGAICLLGPNDMDIKKEALEAIYLCIVMGIFSFISLICCKIKSN